MFLRSDISAHITRNFTSTVSPAIERQVKDAVTQNLIPTWAQQTSQMHQELSRELRSEILGLKKDVTSWQNEAIRNQEVCFDIVCWEARRI